MQALFAQVFKVENATDEESGTKFLETAAEPDPNKTYTAVIEACSR